MRMEGSRGCKLFDFSVGNLGPFRDKVTLSMDAVQSERLMENLIEVSGYSLLRCAAVFGPNASGKTYLLRGLQALQLFLSEPYESGFAYPWYEPFGEGPVDLGIRLFSDGVLYDYRISFDRDSVVSESLHSYPLGRRRRVFERSSGKGVRKAVAECTSSSSAYLTVASKLNDALCLQVRDAIMSIGVVFPDEPGIEERAASLLYYDPDLLERATGFLRSLDLGINYVSVGAMPSGTNLGGRFRVTVHHKGDASIPLERESSGIRRLFRIAVPVTEAMENGGVAVVDGLDSGIHPLLVRSIAEAFMFRSEDAQLVFTTHDLIFLDTAKLLRCDQVYFTERNRATGECGLFSLSDFDDVHPEGDTVRPYLFGRFGGIPSVPRYMR